MSLLEIEHAATSPERLGKLLRNEMLSGPLHPLVTRVLQLRGPQDPSAAMQAGLPLGEFQDLALVSGGRFVFTGTTTGVIQLWDLGCSPNMLVNPYPLATLKEDDTVLDMLTQPGPGDTLRLVLVSQTPIDIRVNAYEIEPLAEKPCFKEIGNFVIGTAVQDTVAIDTYCLTRDRFSFYLQNRLCVWDFVNDTWVMWRTPFPGYQLHVLRDNLIQLCPEGIIIWSIPPLLSRVSALDATVENHSPLLHITCPLKCLHFPFPSTWHTGEESTGDNPLHFDVIGVSESGENSFIRYHLHPVRTVEADPDIPSFLPVCTSRSVITNGDLSLHATGFRSGHLTDEHMLLLWRGPRGCVKANISEWTEGRGATVLSHTGNLWTAPVEIEGNTAFDHCPTSGRLCVLMFNEIRIMDYLLPPLLDSIGNGR